MTIGRQQHTRPRQRHAHVLDAHVPVVDWRHAHQGVARPQRFEFAR
jgi:hypothetical protein